MSRLKKTILPVVLAIVLSMTCSGMNLAAYAQETDALADVSDTETETANNEAAAADVQEEDKDAAAADAQEEDKDAASNSQQSNSLTAVYLNGTAGSDSNDGSTAENAVSTFAKAVELAEANHITTITITGTVTVSDTQTWDAKGITLARSEGFTDGSLVKVTGKGNLTIKALTLDGKNIKVTGSSNRISLVSVEYGTLNITDGAVLKNQSSNGGQKNQYCAAVSVYNGTLNMSGGTICDSTGEMGGGIYAGNDSGDGRTAVNLTGGTISGCKASAGGGIYVGRNCDFNMSGGTITKNTAGIGGGIYIYSDGVGVISAGDITYNTATTVSTYNGGGIYVNGDGNYSQRTDGKLTIYNAEIAYNDQCKMAERYPTWDTTIAACPTAKVVINVTDGAVIHDNDNNYEIFAALQGGSFTLSPIMLGGGAYNWKNLKGELLPLSGISWTQVTGNLIAKTDVSEGDGTVTGLNRVKTHITHNSANFLGAAIATNGSLTFGKSDGDVRIKVMKAWDESIAEADRPESVKVDVVAEDGSGTATTVGSVTLNADNEWTATVTSLPKYDSDGREYTYSLKEDTDSFYADIKIEKLADSDDDETTDEYEAVVTNKAIGALEVSKTVAGDGADQQKEFTFTVELSDQTVNGTFDDMEFIDGVAVFKLKHNESATATGLPAGVSYKVSEAKTEGYKSSSEGETGEIAAGETAKAKFVNTKQSDTPKKTKITKTPTKKSSTPKTGDYNSMDLWVVLAVLAMSSAAVAYRKVRR